MLKAKITVVCEICANKYKREIKEFVYNSSEEEIERAKNVIKSMAEAEKKYICNICKSIINS